MLSQQFSTTLIFTESCYAFSFEVYTKAEPVLGHSANIFVAIAIFIFTIFIVIVIFIIVLFCKLMILYTQYYPMSAFCVSLLLVSFHSRWFYLQTAELMFFLTIAIANAVFCWAMVLHAQFPPMNFLLFCVSTLQSTSRYRQFYLVTTGCSLFELVPGSCSSFQLVPRFSMYT